MSTCIAISGNQFPPSDPPWVQQGRGLSSYNFTGPSNQRDDHSNSLSPSDENCYPKNTTSLRISSPFDSPVIPIVPTTHLAHTGSTGFHLPDPTGEAKQFQNLPPAQDPVSFPRGNNLKETKVADRPRSSLNSGKHMRTAINTAESTGMPAMLDTPERKRRRGDNSLPDISLVTPWSHTNLSFSAPTQQKVQQYQYSSNHATGNVGPIHGVGGGDFISNGQSSNGQSNNSHPTSHPRQSVSWGSNSISPRSHFPDGWQSLTGQPQQGHDQRTHSYQPRKSSQSEYYAMPPISHTLRSHGNDMLTIANVHGRIAVEDRRSSTSNPGASPTPPYYSSPSESSQAALSSPVDPHFQNYQFGSPLSATPGQPFVFSQGNSDHLQHSWTGQHQYHYPYRNNELYPGMTWPQGSYITSPTADQPRLSLMQPRIGSFLVNESNNRGRSSTGTESGQPRPERYEDMPIEEYLKSLISEDPDDSTIGQVLDFARDSAIDQGPPAQLALARRGGRPSVAQTATSRDTKRIDDILEKALYNLYKKVEANPWYRMTVNEFSLWNYSQDRFLGTPAEYMWKQAIRRYWLGARFDREIEIFEEENRQRREEARQAEEEMRRTALQPA